MVLNFFFFRFSKNFSFKWKFKGLLYIGLLHDFCFFFLLQKRFVCRSAEYNYESLQCLLSQHDRRAVDERVEFVEAQGVDYFENLCLKSKRPQ